jgi:alkaline phosphatase D
VDIESYADGAYLRVLAGARVLASLSGDLPEPIDVSDIELERGYAYHCLLKSSEFSRIGSRYVVAVRPFEALSQKLLRESQGESELLMGAKQRQWFLDTMQASERTFKVWASEIALQSRHIDLTGYAPAPVELQTRISISAEDWDGFPNERRALLAELAKVGNVVVLSGDLHCFFAGTPSLESDPEARVVELTTGSVSSTTWLDGIEGNLVQDETLPMEVQSLVLAVGTLLMNKEKRTNPHLAFQDLGHNGYSVVDVAEDELRMTLRTLAPGDVATAPEELEQELDELFGSETFRTRAGTADLEREVDGEFLTWNMEEMEFL